MTFTHENLSVKPLPQLSFDDMETQWMDVEPAGSAMFRLGIVYRQATRGPQEWSRILETMKRACRTQTPTLIVGDFNARSESWQDSITDRVGKQLQEFADNQNLAILNSVHTPGEPTHTSPAGVSIIDLALTNSPRHFRDMKIIIDPLSDHNTLWVRLAGNMNERKSPREVINIEKTDWGWYGERMEEMGSSWLQRHHLTLAGEHEEENPGTQKT
eukprot:GILJ01035126.1.p1 GENE.GILJ01035126.1~~GILJ01035126.1.p1  ORF type:complete len:215 (-),score=13.70 GILJ01035126.1:314-958(-)